MAHISSVEYADLPIIDLAKLSIPGGKAMLAQQVHDAMTTSGFFYVINHGHTQAQVCTCRAVHVSVDL